MGRKIRIFVPGRGEFQIDEEEFREFFQEQNRFPYEQDSIDDPDFLNDGYPYYGDSPFEEDFIDPEIDDIGDEFDFGV